jgi:hypothetical protein
MRAKANAYSDKSYVTLTQHRCIVCGIEYDTGEIMVDMRLRNTFEHHTLTGNGLCPEHKKLHEDGFVALVETDPTKSKPHGDRMNPEDAYRTGVLIHLRRTVARDIFNTDIPDDLPMMFIDPEVTELIKKMMPKEEE